MRTREELNEDINNVWDEEDEKRKLQVQMREILLDIRDMLENIGNQRVPVVVLNGPDESIPTYQHE